MVGATCCNRGICEVALIQCLKTVFVLSHLVFISSSETQDAATELPGLLFSFDLSDKAVAPKR